jgi:hypothetical protein
MMMVTLRSMVMPTAAASSWFLCKEDMNMNIKALPNHGAAASGLSAAAVAELDR